MDITQNKTKLSIFIIVILLIVIGAFIFLRKSASPTDKNSQQNTAQDEAKQLTSQIKNATTFNNEADLKEIDTQFQ